MHIWLRAGEKIYINGAVLRVDRKVALELLNDATFLLEHHVIHVEDATTPLRQLYFVVQSMLIAPGEASTARALFADMHPRLTTTFETPEVVSGLRNVGALVEAGRNYEALKTLRALFPIEASILAAEVALPTQAA